MFATEGAKLPNHDEYDAFILIYKTMSEQNGFDIILAARYAN